ncbi:Itch, partial [Symbiodinium sp. KB8]
RIRYGFPTRVLAASEELSGIAEVGLQDGDVLTLEDLHDLFLGSLESGQFTMEELLNKMPPCEGSEASAETLFLKALAAFHIGMQETDFWGAVMAKVRALVGHEDFKKIAPEDVENVSDGLLALQKLFRHHDTHHRMLLVLRALPLRHKARQHTKLSIDRSRFFSSVADSVMDLDRRQMLTRLSVSYVGEKGVDAGGLTRDFFSSFSSTLVDDPQMKSEPLIWKKTGRGSLHPMPYPVQATTYGRQPNRMYQVCGRVFAMAMLHGCKMGCPLSRPFVRIMLNSIPDTLPELIAELNHEAGDQKDFRGNKEFLEKSLEELGLAGTLTFTGSNGCELIPGGATIQVTDENKEDWLRRVLKWELFSSAEHAASWFRAGLVDVLGGHREMKSARCPLLCLFDADTLIELWGKSGVTRQLHGEKDSSMDHLLQAMPLTELFCKYDLAADDHWDTDYFVLHTIMAGMDACCPILAPPHEKHKKLYLGKCPRQCSTSKLSDILQEAMRAHNFRLWVCGFGMKLPVSFFKDCILPLWQDFEVDDMPEEYIEDAVIDIGWQVKDEGMPLLLSCKSSIRDINWIEANMVEQYTMLGKLGQGAGGVSCRARERSAESPYISKAKFYPGGLVHFTLGMPGLSAKGKTNQWMARQRDKFAYILQMMRELSQDRMGGMRIEFRLSCILEDWAGLKEFLIHKLMDL